MAEIRPSDIVKSLAGHDKGRLYIVLESKNEYAILADGKIRQLLNPKRKKLKHLTRMGEIDSPAVRAIITGGVIGNRDIIKSLAAFNAGRAFDEGGK